MTAAVKVGLSCATTSKSDADPDVLTLDPVFTRIFPINSEFLHSEGIFKSDTNVSSVLLEGLSLTYRTSLLFQAAISFTIEGSTVCYVCPHSFTKLPPSVHGMNQANPGSAQRLKMMYTPKIEDLISYLASLHKLSTPPDVLIVDELNHYIVQNEDAGIERSAARLSAQLVDAMHVLKSNSESTSAHLLLGSEPVSKTISEIWPQFFHAVYTLKELQEASHYEIQSVLSTRYQVPALRRLSQARLNFGYTFLHGSLRLDKIHAVDPNSTKTMGT